MGRKITLAAVRNLPLGRTSWDGGRGAVSGFGARRQKGDAVTYVLKYRARDGRQRWFTIGRHGKWTPESARAEAQRLLGAVARGEDPGDAKAKARAAATVAELCDEYLEAARAGRLLTRRRVAKKASTLLTDAGRFERHIKPLLGRLKVAAITRADIEGFRDDVAEGATKARVRTEKGGLARITGGRGTATRTLGLLGAVFGFAVRRGLRPDNPVRGIERHADGQRTRRLSDTEYARIGESLRNAPEGIWPLAVAGARFLLVTGWRRGEMLSLQWKDLDLAARTARLPDTKTGASMRPLSRVACDLLRGLPRTGELVFPSARLGDKPMRGFAGSWVRIVKAAGLSADVTPHVARHSLASVAADLEYSELTIAALLGHQKATITARYTHKADAVLLQAADAVSDRIFALMGDAPVAENVIRFNKPA
jgi:integrase